ncbi:MAG TPA: hypothetical protein VI934_04160, partial [Candidatus Nanoarchaeia archaeon]|nr:hypothetical protein [Candidatus Nanoarchaeia archaeon]
TPKIDGLDQSFMIMAELENCTSSASLLVTSVRTPSSPEISIEPGKDIIDSDESLYVDIEVNPGNSSQELNVYLSDGNRKISKTTSVHLPAHAASTLTAAISPNNRCQQSGSYLLRAEAGELSASRPIAINQAASCQEKSQISTDSADAVIKQPKTEAKLEYELASIPVKVDTNQSFIVELYLNNSGNIPLSADAWSYVYRGSISYSGERMQNLVHLALVPGQENRIYFNLSADVPETELYKVKLRINSSARKTLIELTRDLFITVPSRNITQSVLEKSAPVTKARELSPVTGNIVSEHYAVYESPSAKTAKLTLFFLLAVSVVMNVFLLWKRA